MQRDFNFRRWKLYCNASQAGAVSKPLGKLFQNTHIIIPLLSVGLRWGLATCTLTILPRWLRCASLQRINHQGGIKSLGVQVSHSYLQDEATSWVLGSLFHLERFLFILYSEKPGFSHTIGNYPSLFAFLSAHTFWLLFEEAGGGRATLARGMGPCKGSMCSSVHST